MFCDQDSQVVPFPANLILILTNTNTTAQHGCIVHCYTVVTVVFSNSTETL